MDKRVISSSISIIFSELKRYIENYDGCTAGLFSIHFLYNWNQFSKIVMKAFQPSSLNYRTCEVYKYRYFVWVRAYLFIMQDKTFFYQNQTPKETQYLYYIRLKELLNAIKNIRLWIVSIRPAKFHVIVQVGGGAMWSPLLSVCWSHLLTPSLTKPYFSRDIWLRKSLETPKFGRYCRVDVELSRATSGIDYQ